ncbi:MAG: MGMT family protein [Candidatus Nealsonbacteria bacterium]
MKHKTKFQKQVFKIVKKIPRGKVMTYSEIARKSGYPKAWRAVGNILNKNKDSKIPCHRVIRFDGEIGGYNLGKEKKLILLRKEGIEIKRRKKSRFFCYLSPKIN